MVFFHPHLTLEWHIYGVNDGRLGGEGGDSNPRWACTHAAFRVRYNQPLCHLSAGRLDETKAR